MRNRKLFLIFIIIGIFIPVYIFLHLKAYSINFGEAYYVIPADFMALLILGYYVTKTIAYLVLRNCVNFKLEIINSILVTIPIIYMCWFNGIGDAVSLYDSSVWTAQHIVNGMIVLFVIGNILFFINLIVGIIKIINRNNSAIT